MDGYYPPAASDISGRTLRVVRELIEREAIQNEKIIKRLLGFWVSETEPSVAWRDGKIIGLNDAGGNVVVRLDEIN
jgi:hypothetical protein